MRWIVLSLLGATGWAASAAGHPSTTPPPLPAAAHEAGASEIARRQGEAYQAEVAWERRGAAWSAATRAEDYRLVAAISPAEGGWFMGGDQLRWRDPQRNAVHLRIFAADIDDGRFVPGASVRVHFLDDLGTELGRAPLPYGRYPLTQAYGADLVIPPGAMNLAIEIAPLPWRDPAHPGAERFATVTSAGIPLAGFRAVSGPPASLRAQHAPPALKAAMNGSLTAGIEALPRGAAGERSVGQYRVDYAVFSQSGKARLALVPRDGLTGAVLPDVLVSATLVGTNGPALPPDANTDPSELQIPGSLSLAWHTPVVHYRQDWSVRSPGDYRLTISFTPPSAPRYGRATGKRMARMAELTVPDVPIGRAPE